MSRYFVGLMSGTSADAIDAVLVDFSVGTGIVATHSQPYPLLLKREVHALIQPGFNEIERAFSLDIQLAELFAEATHVLLSKSGCPAGDVVAIGSHGQTIRHKPATAVEPGFSWQIGDPNIIAERTGITTVADFRRRDIAAGGQGAPLVPGFHQSVFYSPNRNRIILNIGGIANITWLPVSGEACGFDTGPGNTLMDAWIKKHQGHCYDDAGQWAASGKVQRPLLDRLLADPFFTLPFPKSSGPERFNIDWLLALLSKENAVKIAPEDVQATLLALTATSIANHIEAISNTGEADIFVCGGGGRNTALINLLQSLLPACAISSTESLGVDPLWVEALAFAWLAKQTMEGKSGNLAKVTGASGEKVLGGIYPGKNFSGITG